MFKPGAGQRADFALGPVQPRDAHAARLADDQAVFQRDLQPVDAGGFAGGSDKDAGGAAFPFQKNRRLVLDLDGVVFAVIAERAHAARHAAQPLQHVQVVRALVEQHAAAI